MVVYPFASGGLTIFFNFLDLGNHLLSISNILGLTLAAYIPVGSVLDPLSLFFKAFSSAPVNIVFFIQISLLSSLALRTHTSDSHSSRSIRYRPLPGVRTLGLSYGLCWGFPCGCIGGIVS